VSDEEKNRLSRVYPAGRVETVLEIGDPDEPCHSHLMKIGLGCCPERLPRYSSGIPGIN
jgi:hypothetical protein